MNGKDQPRQAHSQHAMEQDDSLEMLLTALREATPAPGLEDRLLQRLAAQPQLLQHHGWKSWVEAAWKQAASFNPAVSFKRAVALVPTALAACAVALVAVHLSHRHSQAGTRQAALRHSAAPTLAATPPFVGGHKPEEARTVSAISVQASANRETPTPPIKHAQNLGNTGPTLTADASREASFPAPEMPLTEQERLLLQIAHRNDPVQLALLDPQERNLERMHERAEADRFFAPRPLPAELQHEIDAVVKAQYATPQSNQETTRP